jgi:hypothetical protein
MFKSQFRIKLELNSIKNFYPHHFPAKATKILAYAHAHGYDYAVSFN